MQKSVGRAEMPLFSFLLLLGLWPLVDMLNGYALMEEGATFSNISTLYKTSILIAAVWRIRKRAHWIILVGMVLLGALLFGMVILASGADEESAAWITRVVLVWAIFLVLKEALDEPGTRVHARAAIIWLSAWYFFVLAANVVMGTFGVGDAQYEGVIGGKGFIYSGNELSLFLLAVSTIIGGALFQRKNALHIASFFGIALIIGVLKATKTVILGNAVIFLLGLLLLSRVSWYWKALVSVAASAFALSTVIMLATQIGLDERVLHFFESRETLAFLLSDRDSAALRAIESFAGPQAGVFGVAYIKEMGLFSEIDVIDVLSAFGFGGVLFFYSFWVFLFLYAARISAGVSGRAAYCQLNVVLFVGLSCTAGHVVYSGIAAAGIALLGAYCFSWARPSERLFNGEVRNEMRLSEAVPLGKGL